ncbi:T-cell immunoglobulin and mucin domain-containing protein 4-like [Tachyglossus aculeatus]|uniref:T-cell immunoglobulin and mucin domain-containing protein 4-like n=1 Tax=Tachyglossus aculeatus TaxID=9261 RepID=UPI0018F3C59C|nr:T-cell immunoglobulin and mucin domain-containing protein 4-like [Tachyglossus aculeatus]
MYNWVLLLWIVGKFSIVCAAPDKLVRGEVGQSVQLPCSYRTDAGSREVCWGKGRCPNSKCNDRLLQTDGSKVTFRKSWKYQLNGLLREGNVALTITDAKEGDSGVYCCRIEVPGWFNDIKINVRLQIRKVPTTTKKTTTTTTTTTCPPTTPLQPTTATTLQITTATTLQQTTTTLPPTTSTLHTTTATTLEPTTSPTLPTTSAPTHHLTTATTLQTTTATTFQPTTTTLPPTTSTLHTTTATTLEPTTSPTLPTTSAPTRHITTATTLQTTSATTLQGTTAPALQITTATTVQNTTATPFQPTTAITLQAITTALFTTTLWSETFLSTKELVTSFTSHALQTTLKETDEETSRIPKVTMTSTLHMTSQEVATRTRGDSTSQSSEGTSDVSQKELDQINNPVYSNLLLIIVPVVAAGLLTVLLGILLRGKVMQRYYLAKYTSFKMKKEPENILGDTQIEMNGEDNLFIL